MKVEAACYSVREMKREKTKLFYIVSPGDWVGIDFMGEGVKIAVFCNFDRASILIQDPKRKINVFKQENLKDLEEVEIDNYFKIKIFEREIITIYPNTEEITKAVSICLNQDDQKQAELFV
jgi:hypothetical protein